MPECSSPTRCEMSTKYIPINVQALMRPVHQGSRPIRVKVGYLPLPREFVNGRFQGPSCQPSAESTSRFYYGYREQSTGTLSLTEWLVRNKTDSGIVNPNEICLTAHNVARKAVHVTPKGAKTIQRRFRQHMEMSRQVARDIEQVNQDIAAGFKCSEEAGKALW